MDIKQDNSSTKIVQHTGRHRALLWFGWLFRFCFALAIIAGATTLSWHWMTKRPTAQRRPSKPEAVLVETITAVPGTEQIMILAMGSVIPAAQIQLAARVSGQIIEVSPNFAPGGYFKAGEKILQVDRSNYDIAVRQQEGNLVRAETDSQIEMGQQSVARREYELLLGEVAEEDADLLLRKPHLAAKEAAVHIAQAGLDKARLDLEWTSVFAPFPAIINTRSAELGSYVSPGAALATLVKADVFWVETVVSAEELKWFDIPDNNDGKGSGAKVFQTTELNESAWRKGTVVRLLPELEPQGRMARVLIEVRNPQKPPEHAPHLTPLLLGSFVRTAIEGKKMDGIV